jgi:SAM-dependent methyltransferase
MKGADQFSELARYYDPLMEHVDYARWFTVVTGLSNLLSPDFRHLDASCGTGTLMQMLRKTGWDSLGFDLSGAMLRHGRQTHGPLPVTTADLRALPFCSAAKNGGLDYITCLFDSMNFLLEEKDICEALRQFKEALNPGGILYFDIVTERMVTEHFEGQAWEENNGSFSTTWASTFNRGTGVAKSHIRVNKGIDSHLRERIYPTEFIEQAIRDAGLNLLGTLDADTWRSVNSKTTRIDFVAVQDTHLPNKNTFAKVSRQIRALLK